MPCVSPYFLVQSRIHFHICDIFHWLSLIVLASGFTWNLHCTCSVYVKEICIVCNEIHICWIMVNFILKPNERYCCTWSLNTFQIYIQCIYHLNWYQNMPSHSAQIRYRFCCYDTTTVIVTATTTIGFQISLHREK